MTTEPGSERPVDLMSDLPPGEDMVVRYTEVPDRTLVALSVSSCIAQAAVGSFWSFLSMSVQLEVRRMTGVRSGTVIVRALPPVPDGLLSPTNTPVDPEEVIVEIAAVRGDAPAG